jgi:hypothetical protein
MQRETIVYNDFEAKESWQPIVQSVVDARRVLLKVVNRYEQIYCHVSVGNCLRSENCYI